MADKPPADFVIPEGMKLNDKNELVSAIEPEKKEPPANPRAAAAKGCKHCGHNHPDTKPGDPNHVPAGMIMHGELIPCPWCQPDGDKSLRGDEKR